MWQLRSAGLCKAKRFFWKSSALHSLFLGRGVSVFQPQGPDDRCWFPDTSHDHMDAPSRIDCTRFRRDWPSHRPRLTASPSPNLGRMQLFEPSLRNQISSPGPSSSSSDSRPECFQSGSPVTLSCAYRRIESRQELPNLLAPARLDSPS